ncbi:MAG: hypothetical protein A3B70_08415 [Deltaproteobacteria bacterium RIFCSPHIGHO2_02_FULL_40_11]|nr:MAG: hypothetical protein A3B70_08415 [Deltaproteobacteria bacterium RIFCSPHIGHO2_02_FULL_40_11]
MKQVFVILILCVSLQGWAQISIPAGGALTETPAVQQKGPSPELQKLETEKQTQLQLLSQLESEVQEAQKKYEFEQQEYEKVKVVSRDWNRRNAAEASMMQALSNLQDAKEKLNAQKISLLKVETQIEKTQLNSPQSKETRKKINTILKNGVITLGIIVLFIILSALGKSLVNRRIKSMYKKYYARKIISYTVAVTAFIAVINLVMLNMTSLLGTFAVLLPTVLIFIDIFQSFVGWFVIIGPRGYKPGDRIEVDDILGDVIDIGILRTALLEVKKEGQSTGKIVFIPNSHVLKKPFFNYSAASQYIWNEISFLLTHESNWQNARKLLLEYVNADSVELLKRADVTVDKLTNRFMFIKGIMTPTVYTKIMPSGIELTLRYLTTVRDRRNSEDQYFTFAFEKFKSEKDIKFAKNLIN